MLATMKRSGEKKISGATRQPLDDWHFTSVPKGEIEACYLYEYAREFFKRSKHLQKFQNEWNDPAKRQSGEYYDAGGKALDLLRTRCENFPHIDFDYFPKVAWQDLPDFPEEVRKSMWKNLRQSLADGVNDWGERFRKSRFDRLNMATLRQLEPARIAEQELQSLKQSCQSSAEQYAERLLRELETPKDQLLTIFKNRHEWIPTRRVSGETEYGFFAIDWGYSNTDIKRAFGEWLQDQRQERKKLGLSDEKFVSSRGGFADKLNWLGALRVKNHYRKSELVDYPYTELKVDAPYLHYSDLLDAARKATKEIDLLFPSQWSEEDYRRREEELARYRKENSLPIPAEILQGDS